MFIAYTEKLDDLTEDQLQGFFAGWCRKPNAEKHLEILRGSFAVWVALEGERCVGFVNALSDGVFYAYIPLLEVLPKYRGRGIGTELMRRMMGTLEGMYAIDVVCDESAARFYEKIGFGRCVGMVKRDYANQGIVTNTKQDK